jgi:hypothetical protein
MNKIVIGTAVAAGAIAVGAMGGTAHASTLRPDRCSMGVSIAHPHAGQYETLTVKTTAPRTGVQVRIQYKTTSHVWSILTGSAGRATHRFDVGRPTHGFPVRISGTVQSAPRGYATGATCGTSFIPA